MNHDETIKYYAHRANEYDLVYTWNQPGRQDELAELYAISKDTLSGRRVIDMACGTGFWTRIVSEKAKSIVGADINVETLHKAMEKEYHCPVRFVQSDVFHPPFVGVRFDGILATFLVSHVRRQDLDELKRIIWGLVMPETRLFLCDNNLTCELKPELIRDEEDINTYKQRKLADGREYVILKNYFEKDELIDIFEQWGRIDRLVFKTYYWALALTINRVS